MSEAGRFEKGERERSGWKGGAAAFAGLLLVLLALPFARGDDLLGVLVVLAGFLALVTLASGLSHFRPERRRRLHASLDRLADRLDRLVERARAGWILFGMIALYAGVWSLLSILRHAGLNSSGFDLAIQHQVIWNLAHGRGFASSIEVGHYLGDHVAATLVLFAPLLWIWDDVRILLIAQSIVLGLGAWPLYRLARRRCGSRLEGLLWAAVYLCTPAIGFMNKYDFHSLVLAVPLLLAAVDAIDSGRLWRASLWMLLALLTREEVGLVVAGLGLWTVLARRRFAWGGGWLVVALAWSLFALYVVIPHFRQGEGSDTVARYAWLGSTPGEIVRTLVTRPWTLLATHYHRVRRLVFPIQLLWPLAGLPLLAPARLALALPNLGLSLTSSAISQNSIYFQYNAPILPILFWAGLDGYRRLRSRIGSRGPALLVLLVSLVAANLADPAAVKRVGRPYTIVDGIDPRPNRDAFREAAARIPSDADLLASNDLAPHVSARRRLSIFHLERPNPEASWVALDLTDTRHLRSRGAVAGRVARWIGEKGYRVDFFRDGILLMRKTGREDPSAREALLTYLAGYGVEPGSPRP